MRSALPLVLALAAAPLMAQVPTLQPQTDPSTTVAAPGVKLGKPLEAGTLHAERKAAKLYLDGVKLLEKQQPEQAWALLKEAVRLAPDNNTYIRAAELARQSTVTQLVQQAIRQHEMVLRREEAGMSSSGVAAHGQQDSGMSAVALLQRALAIDPQNPMVLEHLDQLADKTAQIKIGTTSSTAPALLENGTEAQDSLSDGSIELQPKTEKHSFHTRGSERQIVTDVFRAYGIDATEHDSVKNAQLRLDMDDATFPEAMRVLGMLTHTFYEPVDPHRVVVADDTRENRAQFQRLEMETVYLGGMPEKELTEVNQIARNVFDVQQETTQNSTGTLTVRAPAKTLVAFNQTLAQLEQGKGQVDLDVKVIQLAHIADRETGATLFQQTGVYNAYSEIQSIINSNQSAIQQIIASGLVPNDTTLNNQITIIGILLAAGQLSGSIFNNGILEFGNGLTASLLSVSPATLTMSLTSSDSRILDDIHLQLSDGEDGTFKIGERYPIETSSFSSVALPAISGISSTAAAAASQTIPQIQYEDIGLTLKATPKIMRSNDVALTIDLKITSLGGTSLNSIPILNSQQATGVITLIGGETAIMASDLSSTESRALNGLPGIGDIPGLQDFNDIQKDRNVSRLLILITPRVVRDVQSPAKNHMLMVDKTTSSHAFN
jgi:type II secretory pathway component GspD/PulD (secretin)